MRPGLPGEDSSFWADATAEDLPSGPASAGSGAARRWCFRQPLGVDSAAAALQ